jgi:ornithine carbamoyltransferase
VISAQLKGRDFLRVNDWDADELLSVLDLADRLKARQRERVEHKHLEGRSLGMIFQKPSTRTRVSFEAARSISGPVTYSSGAARRSRTPARSCPATWTGS